jgi:3-oxoacyl-[acyl-carrier-protein] synthase III
MLKYIDCYIPEGRISVSRVMDSVQEKNKLPSSFQTKEAGVSFFNNVLQLSEVSYAHGTSEIEMIDNVIQPFLDKQVITPAEIDLILLVDDELDKGSRIPNLGHYLQHTYSFINADVMLLSGNHCANGEYAFHYGELLLASGKVKSILIVAINKLRTMEDRLIANYAIQGDAAAIALLTNETQNTGSSPCVVLKGKYSITNGAFYEADLNKDNSLVLCKYYIRCLSGLMSKYNLKAKQIDYALIQNASHLLISQCLNSVGFKSKQVFTENNTRYGHLDCIDFLLNLKELSERKPEKSMQLISFGSGWAGSYISLYMEII